MFAITKMWKEVSNLRNTTALRSNQVFYKLINVINNDTV